MKSLKLIKEHFRKSFKAKKCAKYDLQGHLLDVYHSVKEAAKENDLKTYILLDLLNRPNRIPKENNGVVWKSFLDNEIAPKRIK